MLGKSVGWEDCRDMLYRGDEKKCSKEAFSKRVVEK